MKKLNYIDWIAIIFLILGLSALLSFVLFPPIESIWGMDPQKAANLGTYVGGYVGAFFLLISLVILILTLSMQRKSFQIQQFEVKFLDLLKLHRENVSELSLENKIQRSVFVVLRAEFQDIYLIVKEKASDQYSNKLDLAQITYIILFFGLGETSTPMIKKILENYDPLIISEIVKELEKFRKPSGYKEMKYLKNMRLDDYTPLNGHQSRLAHYYRHIFQTITYIDKQGCLTEDEKKYYAKTFRAQMSNHELAIFFYNSLSPMGNVWRDRTKTSTNNEMTSYFEKYSLLKNLPLQGFTYELNPEEIIPLEYEWNSIIAQPVTRA